MNNMAILACLIFLMGCSSGVVPNTGNMADLMEQKLTQATKNSEVPTTAELEELKKQGLSGYFFVTARGSNQFQGPALFTLQISDPETLEWKPIGRGVSELTEEHGRAFFYPTIISGDPETLLRYLITMKLVAGAGEYTLEIAQGGANFTVIKAPEKNQVVTISIFPCDENKNDKIKNSQWELTTKRAIFDEFIGKKVTKEATQTIARQEHDQLWLIVKKEEIGIISASTLEAMNKREKPDLTVPSDTKIIMKRLDP